MLGRMSPPHLAVTFFFCFFFWVFFFGFLFWKVLDLGPTSPNPTLFWFLFWGHSFVLFVFQQDIVFYLKNVEMFGLLCLVKHPSAQHFLQSTSYSELSAPIVAIFCDCDFFLRRKIASDCDSFCDFQGKKKKRPHCGCAGGGAQPRPRRAPGQRSVELVCLERVSVMLRNSVLDDCLFRFPLVSAVVSAVV